MSIEELLLITKFLFLKGALSVGEIIPTDE
jgi:hypothetical protein